MMKKLLILLTFLIVAIVAFPQTTSVQTGNWNNPTTWSAGVPNASTNATIVSPHVVTVTGTSDAGAVVTVNQGATLTINSGATLTTSGNLIVAGTLNQNGTCVAGNAVNDMFHINGGTFSVGNGSTTTIYGYYKQQYVDALNVGTITATGGTTATVNVAFGGVFNDNTNNIFHFGDNCVSTLTGATVNVNILYGNSGTADEVFIGSAIGVNPGTGTVTVGNGSSTVSDWTMVNNSSFGYVDLDIGTGNTLNFSNSVDRTTNTVIFFGLTVTSGTFQIEPGSGLKIVNNNQLTVGANGTLVLDATSSGTGELIFDDDLDDVDATVSRYIVGNDWHLITPSTTGATTANIHQGESPNVWLQEFLDGTQTWSYIIDEDLDDPLTVGKGYAVWGEQLPRVDDFTISYTGDLRSQDLTISGIGSAGGDYKLIGNPFSSSHDIRNSLLGATNLYNQMYIYDPSGSNQWLTYVTDGSGTHSGIVAQGQGFFVEASAASGSITLAANDRKFGSATNFYKDGLERNYNHGKGIYAMFTLSSNISKDFVFVNFGENGTRGFENGYDAKKYLYEFTTQMYISEGEYKLSTDYLEPLQDAEEEVVVMNLKPVDNSECTITANLDSLLSTRVTLEDLKTGIMHEFNTNRTYTFNADTLDAENRFLLHFMYSPTGIEDPVDGVDESSLHIYAYGKAVYISNTDENTVESTIVMYDLMGREIYNNVLELGSYTRIPVNVNNTYLIVKVIKGSEVVTQKVFVQ